MEEKLQWAVTPAKNSQRARTFVINSEFSHRKGQGRKDIFLLSEEVGAKGRRYPVRKVQREKLPDLKVRCDSEKQ